MFNISPPPPENRAIYEIMRKNTVEPDRSKKTIWHIRIACWIPKATNTHIIYRVIREFLRDFRPLRYSSRNGHHAEGDHVNRGRDTPSFRPTLQVLDMSTLRDAADVNPVLKFLPHTLHVCGRSLITGLTSAASPRVAISSTCKVGQKLGVSPSVDMLPFGVTIPATEPQRSEIPEGLMNDPV